MIEINCFLWEWWNRLPSEVFKCPSLEEFKTRLDEEIRWYLDKVEQNQRSSVCCLILLKSKITGYIDWWFYLHIKWLKQKHRFKVSLTPPCKNIFKGTQLGLWKVEKHFASLSSHLAVLCSELFASVVIPIHVIHQEAPFTLETNRFT